jgi:hypothetical protein
MRRPNVSERTARQHYLRLGNGLGETLLARLNGGFRDADDGG